jgi:hypothetical protein
MLRASIMLSASTKYRKYQIQIFAFALLEKTLFSQFWLTAISYDLMVVSKIRMSSIKNH